MPDDSQTPDSAKIVQSAKKTRTLSRYVVDFLALLIVFVWLLGLALSSWNRGFEVDKDVVLAVISFSFGTRMSSPLD